MAIKQKKPLANRSKVSTAFRVNDEIRLPNHVVVRVLEEGKDASLMTMGEARELAETEGLDLVEIQGRLEVPVMRVCQYDKMLYELKKKEKAAKQNASKPMKEIQLSVRIAQHDLQTKANSAKKFLIEGSKVKVVLSMRGRELARRDENKKSLLEFITLVEECGVPESAPKDEGNKTIVILKRRANYQPKAVS